MLLILRLHPQEAAAVAAITVAADVHVPAHVRAAPAPAPVAEDKYSLELRFLIKGAK